MSWLKRDSLKYKEKISLKESGLPLLILLLKNKSLQQGIFLPVFLLLNFNFLNTGPTKKSLICTFSDI